MSRLIASMLLTMLVVTGCGADVQAPEGMRAKNEQQRPTLKDESEGPIASQALPTSKLIVAATKRITAGTKAWRRYDHSIRDPAPPRREIFIEMLGASESQSVEVVTEAFATLGLKPDSVTKEGGNGVSIRFRNVNPQEVWVFVEGRKADSDLKKSDATASVTIKTIPKIKGAHAKSEAVPGLPAAKKP